MRRGDIRLWSEPSDSTDDHELDDEAGWFPFHVAMGHVWRALGENARALASWEAGLKDDCYCAVTALAAVKIEDGDEREAASLLQRLLDEGHRVVASDLATLQISMGELEEAVDTLRRGAELGSAECAHHLGILLQGPLARPLEAEGAFAQAFDWVA